MTLYRYNAISRKGEKLAGEIEAVNRQNVIDQLSRMGHLPVDVLEFDGTQSRPDNTRWSLFNNRPSANQITLFTRELSMLLSAGQPISDALELLTQDKSSERVNSMVRSIQNKINEGNSLHESLVATGFFPPIYTNMIRVAEASGTLETVLERIAENRERDLRFRQKVLSALLYPGLLVVIAFSAVIIMLAFVVPRFKQMIVQASVEIPRQTQFIIAASDWLLANWQLMIFSTIGLVVLTSLVWRQFNIAGHLTDLATRLPLVGTLLRYKLTISFCRTLGTLLENGVELPRALLLTRDSLGNSQAASLLDEAHNTLRKGEDFLKPLSSSNLFPSVVINMLRVSAETGDLHRSCRFLAKMFEDKMDIAVKRTFTILEPVIIIIISIFVAGIIISILGAVISINDLAI